MILSVGGRSVRAVIGTGEQLGRRWAWRRVDPGLLMQRRPRHDVAPTIEEHLREPAGEQGWALIDVATGEPVLLVDDGYGSPSVAGGLFGPVADLLARAPELEAQVRLLQQALLSDSPPLREQVRRNVAAQAALADEFGLLTAADVAQMAGSTAAHPERLITRWREEGRVLAVPAVPADGTTRFPGFQFDERGVPLPVIADVLTAGAGRLTEWELALWFTAPCAWLGDRRPVDVLDTDPDLVVQAAVHLVEELP